MPIIKNINTPNGAAVAFHCLRDASFAFGATHVTVRVASWANENDYLDGKGLIWMWDTTVSAGDMTQLETALITDGFLAGGTVVSDAATTVEGARVRRWAQMKIARQAVIDAPLVTPYGTFDSDQRGRDSIKEAVLFVNNKTAMGDTSPIRYTLADDTRPEFTAEQIIQVGMLLAAKVQAAYDTGDSIRQAIDAAATVEEVQGVNWP
jgi:hypothetical protein